VRVFVVDLLFAGSIALRSLAFVFDLIFAGAPDLIVTAASQTSPNPLPSLSACDEFGIPTQLS
jgi:hypothetical protein